MRAWPSGSVSDVDIQSERADRSLSLAHLQHRGGIIGINQDRQPLQTGDNLAQEFEALAGKLSGLIGQAGHVAAGSRQARDEFAGNRVRNRHEDDRDGRCRLLCSEGCRGSRCD